MTNVDLFRAIGDVDEALIEELNLISAEGQISTGGQKKRSLTDRKYLLSGRRVFAVAVTVCAVFFLCILVRQLSPDLRLRKTLLPEMAEEQFAKDWDASNPELLKEDTMDDREQAEENITAQKKAILGEVQINHLDSLYANAKFGGTLKEVSEKQWQKQYGKADFLEEHPQQKKNYSFSYSKQKEILYGVLHLELFGDQVEMLVDDGTMLDSSFEELKKTKIGQYEIALCQSGAGNYSAIIPDGDVFYTIEENEMTLEEFKTLIEEVFDAV